VPTLIDEDMPPLWESGVINRYLASRYGNNIFWPKDIKQRTVVDQWAEWSKINIALNFTSPVFWQVVRTAPSKQNQQAIAEALKTLHKFLLIADSQLHRNTWLAGSEFTLADVQFGHVLYRYFDIEIERKPLANVERYYAMLTARADFQRAVMVSYEALRVFD